MWCGDGNWIRVGQDRNQCNTAVNFWIPYVAENALFASEEGLCLTKHRRNLNVFSGTVGAFNV
jgi:hypothetical protein